MTENTPRPAQSLTVAELVAHLQKLPQDMLVAFRQYSEYLLLEPEDIRVLPLCVPRLDGWVAEKRPDRPTQDYLVFPGN